MANQSIQQIFAAALQHHQAGRLREAEELYGQILAGQAGHGDAVHLVGVIALQRGQYEGAVEWIGRSIGLNPQNADAYSNLGHALTGVGRLEEAVAACRKAIALRPGHAEAWGNLGIALKNKGELEEAIGACRQAVVLRPNYARGHNSLGNALREKERLEEAVGAYRRAIELDAGLAEAHCNLGNALKDQGKLDEAIEAYRRTLALQPERPEVYSNLGNALKERGQLEEALAAGRRALASNPNMAEVHSGLIFNMLYHAGFEAGAIAEEHRRWDRLHAAGLGKEVRPHLNERVAERRLRIGYVSPDLRDHPVGRFLLPLWEEHDRERFEIFAYAQVAASDGVTEKLRGHCDHWRAVVGRRSEQVAELIREDRIDILVDLAGHTAFNGLLVFARRPAPVQVTYLGYPATTGLGAMDYRLTDGFADPVGMTEAYHTEELVRLAPCAWCYRPMQSPEVAVRGREGAVTFGSFNTLAKVTERMLGVWGRILREVAGSRLMLKAMGLGSAGARQRVLEVLAREGIGAERVELRGHEAGYEGHLALYGRMDIGLDTFPYQGTNTTCEALWMGVPVVSLAGAIHVSRVGVSLLSNAGLPELVGRTEEEYVKIAVGLAGDRGRLAELRGTLRERIGRSALMDGVGFARSVEGEYRAMWRRWCAAERAG